MSTQKANGKDQPTPLSALLTEIAVTEPAARYSPLRAGDDVLGTASDFLLRIQARRTMGLRHAEVLAVQARYETSRSERERMFREITDLGAKNTLLESLYAFQLSQEFVNLAGQRVVLRRARDGSVAAVVTRSDEAKHRQTLAALHHLSDAFLEEHSGGDHDCRETPNERAGLDPSELPPEVAAILKAMGIPLDRVKVVERGGLQEM